MDAGSLRDWAAGEKLTASHMQDIKRMLESYLTGPGVGNHGEGSTLHDQQDEHRIVWVINGTAGDLTAGKTLALDDVASDHKSAFIGKFLGEGVYSGATPEDEAHRYRYAVIQHDLGAGSGTIGVVSGETFAKINVSDINHDFCTADVDGGTYNLVSAETGNAHILWKANAAGTGEMWARVRLSNPPPPASDTTDPDYRYFCMSNALEAATTCAGYATAVTMEWDPDACSPVGRWDCTEVTFTAYEVVGKFSKPVTRVGYPAFLGVARKWPDSERWEILQMEHLAKWIMFTLREDAYNATEAGPLCTITDYWDGHDPGDCFDDGADFRVLDPMQTFPRGLTNCVGIAVWDSIEATYKMVFCQEASQFMRGAAKFDFTAITTSVTLATPAVVMNREGAYPDTILAFKNTLGWCGDAGAELVGGWSDVDDDYILVSTGVCPNDGGTSGTVDVTGSPIADGCSGTASGVTTTDVESITFNDDWFTVSAVSKDITIDLPTVTVDVVTDVDFTAGVLKQTKKTITVLCASDGTDSDIFTGTACP